jgi:hypothetical protein
MEIVRKTDFRSGTAIYTVGLNKALLGVQWGYRTRGVKASLAWVKLLDPLSLTSHQ